MAPVQLRAIKALLTLPTTVAAAEEIGVHPRTISRWFKERAFRAEYLGQMSELQTEIVSSSAHLTLIAIQKGLETRGHPSLIL